MNTYSQTTPVQMDSQLADRVCKWLVSEGFTVTGSGLSTVHGPDIIAHHPARGTWRIVARDERIPIEDHVMAGFFTAAAMAEGQDAAGSRIGLALPRSPVAEHQISKIRRAMGLLGIVVLWVEASGIVTIDEYRGKQKGLRPEELNASNDG